MELRSPGQQLNHLILTFLWMWITGSIENTQTAGWSGSSIGIRSGVCDGKGGEVI